jgi:hypothetical protein
MEAAKKIPIEDIEIELTLQQELDEMSLQIQSEILELNNKTKYFLKRLKNKQTISDDEEQDHAHRWKLVKQLEKAYSTLYKVVYPKGNKQLVNPEGRPDINKIKSQQGTVGAIVRKIE